MEIDELIKLAKECLSIVSTSTLKNNEIELLINSALKDFERVGIVKNTNDKFQVQTIMLYVKAHFGDIEPSKKQKYIELYKDNLRSMQFSEEYTQESETDSDE